MKPCSHVTTPKFRPKFSPLKLYIVPMVTSRNLGTMEFSLNGAELSLNSVNSGNLRNYWGMNWVQYNALLCCLWLCGWVVESLSLTQEILGSNPAIFLFDFQFFCHWIQRIQWKHLEKTPLGVELHLLLYNPKSVSVSVSIRVNKQWIHYLKAPKEDSDISMLFWNQYKSFTWNICYYSVSPKDNLSLLLFLGVEEPGKPNTV